MKKVIAILFLQLPLISIAQLIDISAHGGIAPYKMSAGIKNGFTSAFNLEVAYIKVKGLDFGVQLLKTGKVTICDVIAPGIFANAVIHHQDEDKHLFIAGVHLNYAIYGSIKRGGEYGTQGGIDTVTTKADNALSYGIRVGYRRRMAEHFYASLLICPSYSIAPIHYTNMPSGKFNLLVVPVMLGISARL